MRSLRHLEEGLSAALLLVGLCIVLMEIGTRSLAAGSFLWSEEVSRYTLIWLTYLGAAAAVRSNSHIRVTAFSALLPRPAQRWLELVILALCLFFTVYVAYWGIRFAQGSAMLGLMSSDSNLVIPIWVFHTIVPIGFGLMSIRLVERMVRILIDRETAILDGEG
jgi:C4-dicarboxylate transporter, DctQ subunit